MPWVSMTGSSRSPTRSTSSRARSARCSKQVARAASPERRRAASRCQLRDERVVPGRNLDQTVRLSIQLAATRALELANVVDAHAESLGVESEGALPGRARQTALVVGLEPRER